MNKNGKQIINQSGLDNGLTIVTERLPYLRSVAFSVWLKAGSRYETSEINGISHFIEHLVFKGTEELRSKDISLKVDQMGGAINAFTTRHEISFFIKVLDTEIDNGIDLITEIISRPAFRKKDIELERNVILEEIKMYEDSPDESVSDKFFEKFWANHSIGRPVQGKLDSVSGLSREQIVDYFTDALSGDRIVVAAAGNLDHNHIVDLVTKKLGHLEKKNNLPAQEKPVTHSFRDIAIRPTMEQVRFILGREGVTLKDDSRYASLLLSTLLGGNSSSRLFQKAREERGLVYDISSASFSYGDTGVFAVSAGTNPDAMPELMEIIHTEIVDMMKTPPTDEELMTLKNYVKGNMVLAMEDSSARMNRLARYMLYYDRYYTVDEVIGIIDAITPKQIQEAARSIFQGKWSLGLIKPDTDIEIDDNLLNVEI